MENLVIVGSDQQASPHHYIRYGLISHRLSLQKEWAVWKRQRRLIIFMEMRKV